ncbi:hypothetical protein [Caballeronia sp. Lep1P3]|uniref:hypothetical protein n=1 Tax=Caballeronia sp. Lep1P3 TaxID=2878150 RepID=UPI001FD3ECCD|nr:hypothetical protein [Caballeronia sp. Lep1P3]
MEDFFWVHKGIVEAHLAESVAAATQYFSKAIGDAKRVLVVDIGWSGTCISSLRHFVQSKLADAAPEVFGALMCTSRSEQVTNAVSEGFISAYV